MARTARELIIDAYRTASIVPDNDTPTGNELEIGLKELNGIINVMNTDSIWPYTNLIVSHTFTNGDNEFTIGSYNGVDAVDIDAQRPNDIKEIRLLIGNVWYPLNQDSPVTFDSRAVYDNIQAIPQNFTYRTDFPYGVIRFSEGFSNNYPGEIVYSLLITNYLVDDTISLPVGYEDTLEYALASNLCLRKGFDNPYVVQTAKSRMNRLMKNNIEIPELNLPGGKRKYNPYSDRNN